MCFLVEYAGGCVIRTGMFDAICLSGTGMDSDPWKKGGAQYA